METGRECAVFIWEQSQASGLTWSDRNAKLPVSTRDPGAQGPSLDRKSGGSVRLQGERLHLLICLYICFIGVSHTTRRPSVPWDLRLFYFLFRFAWGLTQCSSYVNVCWRLAIWLLQHTQGFNLPSPSVQIHSESLPPSLSFPSGVINNSANNSVFWWWRILPFHWCLFLHKHKSHLPRRAVFLFCSRFLPVKTGQSCRYLKSIF